MTTKRRPYSLTLSRGLRAAMDWVGDRYEHGNDFYRLLADAEWQPDDVDWNAPSDITFHIDEPLAWMIRELLENSDFSCTPLLGQVVREQLLDKIV